MFDVIGEKNLGVLTNSVERISTVLSPGRENMSSEECVFGGGGVRGDKAYNHKAIAESVLYHEVLYVKLDIAVYPTPSTNPLFQVPPRNRSTNGE